ncbi:MAG: DUF4965 domain-containing protein [Firmicutes bacterium]|nr:DUF4965 domain-containing protein [Bacillota bacterium]
MLKFNSKKKEGRLLPAYPLFVKDPFFSVWSGADRLNKGNTMFWTGKPRKMYGMVSAGGKVYSFMGLNSGAVDMEQTYVDITSFDTRYGFTCGDFDLDVTFTSPLNPDDPELLSCPVCYFRYTLKPKRKLKSVTVALFIDQEFCYDKVAAPIRGGRHILSDGTEAAWFGLKKQLVMSQSYDDSCAEWGYYYLTGKKAFCTSEASYHMFKGGEPLEFNYNVDQNKMLAAADEYDTLIEAQSGMMTVAFDDTCSIFYFGDWLKGYYFEKTGKNIVEAIESSIAEADKVFAKCNAFDRKLKKMAKPYGEDYLLVLYGGLRQAVGAHKLVLDRKGNLLFLSKENHSNGCICTVDVSYPSIPLFLLFNPALVRAMCEPIFKFARMPVWKFDFAPHDVGTYPYCFGQLYGIRYRNSAPDENCIDGSIFPRAKLDPEWSYTYPMWYTFPENHDLYIFERQMPVEECGNMLIMSAAALLADGDKKMAKDNWDLLSMWVEYLIKYGLMPGNQLCTDDFAGHLDKNINLSVKAIVGIEAYAIIADKLGFDETGAKYHAVAKDYADKWKEMCFDGEKTPLVFGGNADETFSLKYNMAFDVIFGSKLFDSVIREKEVDRYIELSNTYGVPLDSRSSYTKSDWILWSTVLTDSVEKRKALIAPVARFLRESESRYPFTDYYYTDSGRIVGTINKWGRHRGFKNRSVQGGLFIALLADSKKCENKKI